MNTLDKELKLSAIDPNEGSQFVSVNNFNESLELLLYGLDDSDRTNTGKLRAKWLKTYDHLNEGGWWCKTIDPRSGAPRNWGIFKPNKPRVNKEGKTIKYETPPKVHTETFVFPWRNIWGSISSWDQYANYDGVLPPELWITEGAKKTAALVSQGEIAIGLTGVYNGFRDHELTPDLDFLTTTPKRVVICFDQDSKHKTRGYVARAVQKLGLALTLKNCHVSVASWDQSLGKGIDDYLFNGGSIPGVKLTPIEDYLKLFDLTLKPDPTDDGSPPVIYGGKRLLSPIELLDFCKIVIAPDIAYNELTDEILYKGERLDLSTGCNYWFLETFGESATTDNIENCLTYIAQKNRFNPVVDYLRGNKATPIDITNLASRWFNTDNPIYNRMLELWLISAVARALTPITDRSGVQADYTLILQGKEGAYKTSFFRELARGYFSDSVGDISKKDSWLIMNKHWLIELSEFDNITSRKHAGELKHFLTKKCDEYRKPYDKRPELHPRRVVFAGTVNPRNFLTNGENRRFWVIPTDYINIELVKNDVDRVWAAAYARYRAGDQWWPTNPERDQLTLNTQSFRFEDSWEDTIADWVSDRDYVSIFQVLTGCLKFEPSSIQKRDEMRVSAILDNLGWINDGSRKLIGGKKVRVRINPDNGTNPPMDQPTDPGLVHGLTIAGGGLDQPDQPTQPLQQKNNFPEKNMFSNSIRFTGLMGEFTLKEKTAINTAIADQFGSYVFTVHDDNTQETILGWLDNLVSLKQNNKPVTRVISRGIFPKLIEN